jgi:hypothetical protein
MLQFAAALLQWLPRIFVWLVVPIACLSLLLAPARRSRPHAALGFMIAAAVSAVFVAIETAAFGYICCDQARTLFSILLDCGPRVAIGFAIALLGSIVSPFFGVAPMLVGALATAAAAFVLRRADGKGNTALHGSVVVVESSGMA